MRRSGTGVGAVVIGRNEGERLASALRSLEGSVDCVVYVDSASRDASVDVARELGALVVELDSREPLSAARARNEGARALRAARPELELAFFMDGDCELVEGFLPQALEEIGGADDVAIVCGRRRERRPDESIYNRLCEMEWEGPSGDVDACGGDSLVRLGAFEAVGGFDAALIAGEEPDLCLRLRRRGYRIRRIAHDMTLHDAAIARFSEWWRRSERAGHAFTEGALKHLGAGERHWVREAARPWIFGVLLPTTAAIGAVPTLGLSAGLLAAYPISGARAYRSFRQRGFDPGDSALAAAYCVLGRLPELLGSARCLAALATGRARTLIEYKGAP